MLKKKKDQDNRKCHMPHGVMVQHKKGDADSLDQQDTRYLALSMWEDKE